jgi:hypothetical protein
MSEQQQAGDELLGGHREPAGDRSLWVLVERVGAEIERVRGELVNARNDSDRLHQALAERNSIQDARLVTEAAKCDELQRAIIGTLERPGLMRRVEGLEELAVHVRRLIFWAAAGVLSATGALLLQVIRWALASGA